MSAKFAAIGMFDGVHTGHRHLWQQIKALCTAEGASSLAVTFRNHPLELIAPDKAPQYLCTLEERTALLRQAGADDVLVLDFTPELRSLTAAEFTSMLAREHGVTDLVMGFNHSIGCDRVSTPQAYSEVSRLTGVRLHPATEFNLPGNRSVSSSAIRRAINEGDMTAASVMLGRPYSIGGSVCHGQQLGRTIGFPTANISGWPQRQIMPAPGVYALDITLPDKSLRRGMANIGKRPTVETGDNAPLSVEVNIFDFNGNLYGEYLTLHFLKRLRTEQRFDSLDSLREQLQRDREASLSLSHLPT